MNEVRHHPTTIGNIPLSCPICSNESELIVRTRRGYYLARCRSCTVVHATPLPSQTELSRYYVDFSYGLPEEHDFALRRRHTAAGVARFMPIAAELLGHQPQRILDFGGGLGFFSAAMADLGAKVTHFDLDPTSRSYAQTHFGNLLSTVESAADALTPGTYDVILANQVIEHMREPIKLLAQLNAALSPGGLLIVTTPNNRSIDVWFRPDIFVHYFRGIAASYWTRLTVLLRNSWLCCDPPRHLFAFNDASLIKAAVRANLRPLRVDTEFFDLDPYGHPKYTYAGFHSGRATVKTILFALSRISAFLAHLLDSSGQRGSTLICYFSRQTPSSNDGY